MTEKKEKQGRTSQGLLLGCNTVESSTVLYSIVQYSTVQYSTVQHSITQYSTVPLGHKLNTKLLIISWGLGGIKARNLSLTSSIKLYCTVLYCTVLYCTVLYCTVLYCIVLYCIMLYCTILHCVCTVLYSNVLTCMVLQSLMRIWNWNWRQPEPVGDSLSCLETDSNSKYLKTASISWRQA